MATNDQSDQWLKKPSSEQQTGITLKVVNESDVTPELNKALEEMASALAKHSGITSHLQCQKVTIHCPQVTIQDPCNILVTCNGYNG